MSQYCYIVRTPLKEELTGEIEARTEMEAFKKLSGKGYSIVKIKKKGGESQSLLRAWNIRIKREDIQTFFECIQGYEESGMPVVMSMEMIIHDTRNQKFKDVLTEILGKIRQGIKPYEAFKEMPKLPPICLHMLEVGDVSGKMDIAYGKIADIMGRGAQRRNMIIKQMIQPVTVSLAAVAAAIFLCQNYIPLMAGLYRDQGAELPWLTMAVDTIYRLIANNIWEFTAMSTALMLYLLNFKKLHRRLFDRLMLNLPLYRNTTMLDFTGSFLTLVEIGEKYVESIQLSAKTTGNTVLMEIAENAAGKIKEGVPISDAIRINDPEGYFDYQLLTLINAGQNSGEMEERLKNAIKTMETRVQRDIDRLPEFLRVVLIAPASALVAIVAVAAFSPMANIYDVIRASRDGMR